MGLSAEPSIAAASWPQMVMSRAARTAVRRRHWLALLIVVGVFTLSSIPNTLPPRVHGLDKVKHVAEYFVVGLVFLNVVTHGFRRLRAGALLTGWGAVLLVALLDESYQRFVPRRSFDWWDVAASASGGTLALAAVLLLGLGRLLQARSAT